MVAIDDNLTRVGKVIKPDSRQRVSLPKVLVKEGITYHVYSNSIGQIVLDPRVTIPAYESWVFENKDILSAMDKSMTESANGQVVKRGSFIVDYEGEFPD